MRAETLEEEKLTMDPFFANEEKLVRVLFRNVSNAGEIIKLVIRAGLPLCLIKPKFVSTDSSATVSKNRNCIEYTIFLLLFIDCGGLPTVCGHY